MVSDDMGIIQTISGLVPGAEYELTFWVLPNATGDRPSIDLNIDEGPVYKDIGDLVKYNGPNINSTEWIQVTRQFITPGNSITLGIYASRNTVYVDDISLVRTGTGGSDDDFDLPGSWGSVNLKGASSSQNTDEYSGVSMSGNNGDDLTGATLTIRSGGYPTGQFSSTYDKRQMAYTKMSGNFTVTAKIDGFTAVQDLSDPPDSRQNIHSNFGINLRANLTEGSKYLGVAYFPNKPTDQYRSTQGLIRLEQNGSRQPYNIMPGNETGYPLDENNEVWLKLVRYGSLQAAYTSTDGVNWVINGEVYLIPMDDEVYICFFADANDGPDEGNTATFSHITIESDRDVLTATGKFEPEGPPADAQPAFPGAYGFGAATAGGRGGKVVEVTTLADSGPGSLREALLMTIPRTIVFKVSGEIRLLNRVTLRAANSYLTMAGQTAPGEGVQITGWCIEFTQGFHDGIMTHMKFRPGHTGYNDWSKSCIEVYGNGLTTPVYNMMFDHCTFSYGPDENIALWGNVYNVTVQNSITSYGIRHNYPSYQTSGQSEGSKGAIIGAWDEQGRYAITNISFLHNLFAHNDQRNPRISSDLLEFVNNVVYNWGDYATQIDAATENDVVDPVIVTGTRTNIIGNYYKIGVNTNRNRSIISMFNNTRDNYIWLDGNYLDAGNETLNGNKTTGYLTPEQMVTTSFLAGKTGLLRTTGAWETSNFPGPLMTAEEAYDYVLANAGAFVGGALDWLDATVIEETATRTGVAYLTPPDVIPNYIIPVLAGGVPYIDTTKDGLPDDWMIANGLDPADPTVGSALCANGYTYLEHFLYNIPLEAEEFHTVTFNSQGGSDVAPITGIATGSTITAPNDPARVKHDFDGWYKEIGCTEKWDFETDVVTRNITLYAKWVEILDSNEGNLIINGGFENGLEGWREWWSSSLPNGVISGDAGFVYEGNYSLKMSQQLDVGIVQTIYDMEPGTTYDFSYWMKTSGTRPRVDIYIAIGLNPQDGGNLTVLVASP